MNTCFDCGQAVRIVRNPFSRFQSAFMFADDDGSRHDCRPTHRRVFGQIVNGKAILSCACGEEFGSYSSVVAERALMAHIRESESV